MVRRFLATVTSSGVRVAHAESSRAHDRLLRPLLVRNDGTCELGTSPHRTSPTAYSSLLMMLFLLLLQLVAEVL